MIISEARQVYGGQIKAYREQQMILEKKKKELDAYRLQPQDKGKIIEFPKK